MASPVITNRHGQRFVNNTLCPHDRKREGKRVFVVQTWQGYRVWHPILEKYSRVFANLWLAEDCAVGVITRMERMGFAY